MVVFWLVASCMAEEDELRITAPLCCTTDEVHVLLGPNALQHLAAVRSGQCPPACTDAYAETYTRGSCNSHVRHCSVASRDRTVHV
mmetsp:Transcript_6344/g.14049  ORF Transcript_6344/g.14049 Transcript_6344/m.14049 type:complete len:86 (+) Transcript_6344:1671-1928(+)